MAADNKSLGRFILDGIPPAPRGMPQVEVSFDVDANGVLSVTAKDKTSGKSQSIRIEASSGLSDDDIKKMTQDAEAHAEEDKKKKEFVEEKNMADQLIHTAEKSLRDAEGKVSEDIKKDVEEKISALKTSKEGTDAEDLKTKTQALSDSLMKIGEEMQKHNAEAKPEQPTEEKKEGEEETK